MSTTIQYEYWSDFLYRSGAICSPAELQGLVVGILASGCEQDEKVQQDAALLLMDCPGTPDAEVLQAVAAFYPLTLMDLKDTNLGFQLLLPEEAMPVADRTRALSEWCQGFLTGFAEAGKDVVKRLDEEGADALWDFASIAQLEENPSDSNDNEVHLTNLVEYVRMAALNIFAQTYIEPAQNANSIH